jgi:hypothetical protein
MLLLLQVQYVKGLDLSPKEVEEARRRYGELLQRDRGAQQAAITAAAMVLPCTENRVALLAGSSPCSMLTNTVADAVAQPQRQ